MLPQNVSSSKILIFGSCSEHNGNSTNGDSSFPFQRLPEVPFTIVQSQSREDSLKMQQKEVRKRIFACM